MCGQLDHGYCDQRHGPSGIPMGSQTNVVAMVHCARGCLWGFGSVSTIGYMYLHCSCNRRSRTDPGYRAEILSFVAASHFYSLLSELNLGKHSKIQNACRDCS